MAACMQVLSVLQSRGPGGGLTWTRLGRREGEQKDAAISPVFFSRLVRDDIQEQEKEALLPRLLPPSASDRERSRPGPTSRELKDCGEEWIPVLRVWRCGGWLLSRFGHFDVSIISLPASTSCCYSGSISCTSLKIRDPPLPAAETCVCL